MAMEHELHEVTNGCDQVGTTGHAEIGGPSETNGAYFHLSACIKRDLP